MKYYGLIKISRIVIKVAYLSFLKDGKCVGGFAQNVDFLQKKKYIVFDFCVFDLQAIHNGLFKQC